MTSAPHPTAAHGGSARGRELADALRRAGIVRRRRLGLARALYSSDASLYRVRPPPSSGPRHVDEIPAALEVCRALGVPLTARGAGTSIAGNAVGPGRRRWTPAVTSNRVAGDRRRGADGDRRAGRRAGRAADRGRPHGLRFGPDPSTHNRCTIGGMIGNNACGSRALGYGRTSDNVRRPRRRHRGRRSGCALGRPRPPAGTARRPARAWSRASSPRSAPSSAGSAARCPATRCEHLLPERGFDVARALVGSEGTLRAGARRRRVRAGRRRPATAGWSCSATPTMADAADATPGLLRHGPTAVEGMDSRIVAAAAGRPAADVAGPPAR